MIQGITKKQGNNGTPVYMIDGREIEVYIAEFEEIFTIELSKINSMFQAILDTECDDHLDINFAYIGKNLVENLENIESDIDHEMNGNLKVARNNSFKMLPNKKRLRKDSIIDVYFEPRKAPETDLQAASS